MPSHRLPDPSTASSATTGAAPTVGKTLPCDVFGLVARVSGDRPRAVRTLGFSGRSGRPCPKPRLPEVHSSFSRRRDSDLDHQTRRLCRRLGCFCSDAGVLWTGGWAARTLCFPAVSPSGGGGCPTACGRVAGGDARLSTPQELVDSLRSRGRGGAARGRHPRRTRALATHRSELMDEIVRASFRRSAGTSVNLGVGRYAETARQSSRAR